MGQSNDVSDDFEISAGVRQGCVLSPRLFCAALQEAMRSWRNAKERNGLNLKDGLQHLLDLRFADDILLFAETSHRLVQLLETLIDCLESVGLSLDASKTIILTTETQPPNFLRTRRGEQITVLDSTGSHKWFGCMLTSKGSKSSNTDIEYLLQAATKAFYVNKTVFCDKHVSICKRLRNFHTVVTPVVCFGAGPKAIHGVDLWKLDVHFRKLVGTMVGPAPQTNWDSPWHITLHAWNDRVNYFVQQSGIPTWTTSCLQQHWRFARYIANLPANRWVQRVLHWTPMGHATVGRPRIVWESKLQGFCRYKLLGNWLDLAKDDVWIDMNDDFVGFCFPHRWKWRCICFNFQLLCHFRLHPEEGMPHGVQAWIGNKCPYELLGHWRDLAKSDVWIDMIDDFVGFCFPHRWKWRCICFNFRLLCHLPLRPKEGSPHDFQGWNEMKWDEMKWNELKWNEMKWNEMNWTDLKWNEMKWNKMFTYGCLNIHVPLAQNVMPGTRPIQIARAPHHHTQELTE